MPPPVSIPPNSRLHGLPPEAIGNVIAAAQALDMGRVAEAERHLQPLAARFPAHPEILRLIAGVQNFRGQAQAAVATMRRAVQLRPNDPLYFNTLGGALVGASLDEEAVLAFRRACELDPQLVSGWFNLGLLLKRAMRIDEARDALQHALKLAPDLINARIMRGDILKGEGRTDEAIAEYRGIVAQTPGSGLTWWALADVKSMRFDAADITQMREALRTHSASEDDKIALGFALAKALDDHGRYAESLQALAEANERARQRKRWNAAMQSRYVASILDAFTPPHANAEDTFGKEVIFVASLPRSGSTLVEQILASHSLVDGGGELTTLPLLLNEESQRRGTPFPQWVPKMQPLDWRRLGEQYLERNARFLRQRPRFTDKLPGNWMNAGAIRAMLPGARMVIVRRDPLETCLSCYRQRLTDNEYTRTFADLASYWRDFDKAAKHWTALFPEHVCEFSYEALVANPDARVRELLHFCDLPFEQACLEFHKSNRAVHTPSATQVREPLRRDTARAHRYGALLDPLRTALGLPPFAATTSLT
jgi:tetratricopeptide (TPR) repeat protein